MREELLFRIQKTFLKKKKAQEKKRK